MYKLAIASSLLVLVGLEAFNYFLHRFDSHRNKNNPPVGEEHSD